MCIWYVYADIILLNYENTTNTLQICLKVGVFSPFNQKGLNQGWIQSSIYLLIILLTCHKTTEILFYYNNRLWKHTRTKKIEQPSKWHKGRSFRKVNKRKQDSIEQDSIEQESTEQDGTEQDSIEQDSIEQDKPHAAAQTDHPRNSENTDTVVTRGTGGV